MRQGEIHDTVRLGGIRLQLDSSGETVSGPVCGPSILRGEGLQASVPRPDDAAREERRRRVDARGNHSR